MPSIPVFLRFAGREQGAGQFCVVGAGPAVVGIDRWGWDQVRKILIKRSRVRWFAPWLRKTISS